jgi:hypothetical protein
MGRQVTLQGDRLRITWSGLDSVLALKESLELPYEEIAAVEVGLRELPGPFAWRVGMSNPLSDRRQGRFWVEGKRLLLDVLDRDRAVVLRLRSGAPFDVVAVHDDRPKALADAIAAKLA